MSSLEAIMSSNMFTLPSPIPEPDLNKGCFPFPFLPCNPAPAPARAPCELPRREDGRDPGKTSSSLLSDDTRIGASTFATFCMCLGALSRLTTSLSPSSLDRTSIQAGPGRALREDDEGVPYADPGGVRPAEC